MQKSRFSKVKLSCLLFITVVKKMWRLKGVKGGKEAQWGKNIFDFAFEFGHPYNLTRFYGSSLYFRLKLLKSDGYILFSIRLIPFQWGVGTKIWMLIFYTVIVQMPYSRVRNRRRAGNKHRALNNGRASEF